MYTSEALVSYGQSILVSISSPIIKIVKPLLVYNYRKADCWSYFIIKYHIAAAANEIVEV